MRKIIYSFIEVKKAGKNTYFFLALLFEVSIKGRAEYGNRTRLPGLGSPCTTDVLIPLVNTINVEIGICTFIGSLLFNRRADTRTRTGDLRITNALLYQLSHIGKSNAKVHTKNGISQIYDRYFIVVIC